MQSLEFEEFCGMDIHGLLVLNTTKDKNDAVAARKKAEQKYLGEFTPS